MAEMTGEYPVLLLDDVFSELDQYRREYLLNTVSQTIQTIITATELGSWEGQGIKAAENLYRMPRKNNIEVEFMYLHIGNEISIPLKKSSPSSIWKL